MEGRGEGSNDCRACARLGVESSFSSSSRVVSKRQSSPVERKSARVFLCQKAIASLPNRESIFLDIFFPALFFRSINLSFFLSNFLGEDDDDDDARRRRKRQSPLDPHP